MKCSCEVFGCPNDAKYWDYLGRLDEDTPIRWCEIHATRQDKAYPIDGPKPGRYYTSKEK